MSEPMPAEELQKTIEGRLAITFQQLARVHARYENVTRARLVLSPQEFSAQVETLGLAQAHALRESLLSMTEAQIEILARLARVESVMDELSQPDPPSPPAKPRSH